ncbi:MAG: PcfJ domain-containing protein [Oscillospiraceae bacterium]|nr:PcfJ domain-containing protein [Oscillospiraceae bacterium]
MQENHSFRDIYLTAEVTDAVPAARFWWYNKATDEKEPVHYPDDLDDPELELLDNEDDVEYTDVSVLACPFCQKVFRYSEITELPDEIREDLLPYYGDGWKDAALMYDVPYTFLSRCPACGHGWDITEENLFPIVSGKNREIVQHFGLTDDGDCVTATVETVIPALTAEELRIQKQTYRLVFHTATGETVEMTPTGQKDVTYVQPWSAFDTVFGDRANVQRTADRIGDLTGHQPPELETLQQLCLWNRFRWINAESAEKLLTVKDPASYFTDIAPDEPRNVMLQKLTAGIGIRDCKSIRRALIDDISIIEDARVFAVLGFTSVDVFRYALEERKLRELIRYELPPEQTCRFARALISRKGEKAALRCILSDPDYVLRDTANYYARALGQIPEEQCLHMLRGSLSEIHDRLIEHVRIEERANETIEYTMYQHERLDHIVNGITYRLAKDTDELYEVGSRMHNCVATYCDDALRGKSLIVVGRDEKHVPVLCIELNGFSLVQLKADRNAIPAGDLAEAALRWADAAQVYTGACEDYREALQRC